VFKHRSNLKNFGTLLIELSFYYTKRVFLRKQLSKIVMLNENLKTFLPVDSLCEVDMIREDKIYSKAWKITSSSIVIDIGAHVGIFALSIAKKVSKVVAIEPNKESFSLLQKNIFINEITNIVPLNIALGDYNGNGVLHHDKSSLGHSFFKPVCCTEVENVKVATLDSLNVSHIDFIKINAEGMELRILQGAQSTLCKMHPTIAIATMSHPEKQVRLTKKFLRKLGYTVCRGKMGVIHASKLY
jgi:FkbM family methyltransferase